MPIIHYPDNFKIEVVKHYKMHHIILSAIKKAKRLADKHLAM